MPSRRHAEQRGVHHMIDWWPFVDVERLPEVLARSTSG